MITEEHILLHHGAYYKKYPAKEIIFQSGDVPRFFIQIRSGTVELNNYHDDGREFTLNILSMGDSIGGSLLFSTQNYPMNAIAKTDCIVLKLSKSKFLEMVKNNSEIALKLLEDFSHSLYHKYTMLFNNSSIDPLAKITSLLDYYKRCANEEKRYCYHLPLTRQQIANLTGLRVETVIRTIKRMEELDLVHLKHRQIYY
ncbi:Crp/Fnr family transcriptional regulator [Chryseobacterium sp. ON_d1]|uniref:Crp/Fnr family transcriptional regulator n=1 Tax=Chryseobacterium sp. ON_d1 TaxID=2583211 RepID=UPI00115B42D3|nr:Crp/Fnr family transcriptional regulator [Chryseobacterium sp. ON_d1]GEJ45948.1 hypothetical protein CRS_25560 [Chryseobacterium sp. ON_d1]